MPVIRNRKNLDDLRWKPDGCNAESCILHRLVCDGSEHWCPRKSEPLLHTHTVCETCCSVISTTTNKRSHFYVPPSFIRLKLGGID